MSKTQSPRTLNAYVRKQTLRADEMLTVALEDLALAQSEATYVDADASVQQALDKAFDLIKSARKELTSVLTK